MEIVERRRRVWFSRMSSRGSIHARRAYSEVIFWGKFFSVLAAYCVAFFIGCCAEAAVVKITVENVRVGRGKLHLALFNSNESWDREDSILDPEFLRIKEGLKSF